MQVILEARHFMNINTEDDQYPQQYSHLEYDIPGELWYNPVAEGPPPHYFVIFNLENQIAGLMRRTLVENDIDILEPCDFIYLTR